MFARHKYRENLSYEHFKDPVGSIKYDGAHFFLRFDKDGKPSYISRRQSVHGHYPDRTAQLPHLANIVLPEYAGNIYSTELIHTGNIWDARESHNVVSGILNSLPPRAISTQAAIGPVRAVLLDVINPKLHTYEDKIKHLQELEVKGGKPEVFFAPKLKIGKDQIDQLIDETNRKGQEGVIITSLTAPDESNIRWKIKHFKTYNLKVVGMEEEHDIYNKPKGAMGALKLIDSANRDVGKVGIGFDRDTRIEAWKNPKLFMNKLVQVKSLAPLASDTRKLRQAVYNGFADGEIDLV